MFEIGDFATVRWRFRLEVFHLYKNIGTLCMVHCIGTFVERQADDVGRQFTSSDRIRHCCNLVLKLSPCSKCKLFLFGLFPGV